MFIFMEDYLECEIATIVNVWGCFELFKSSWYYLSPLISLQDELFSLSLHCISLVCSSRVQVCSSVLFQQIIKLNINIVSVAYFTPSHFSEFAATVVG